MIWSFGLNSHSLKDQNCAKIVARRGLDSSSCPIVTSHAVSSSPMSAYYVCWNSLDLEDNHLWFIWIGSALVWQSAADTCRRTRWPTSLLQASSCSAPPFAISTTASRPPCTDCRCRHSPGFECYSSAATDSKSDSLSHSFAPLTTDFASSCKHCHSKPGLAVWTRFCPGMNTWPYGTNCAALSLSCSSPSAFSVCRRQRASRHRIGTCR